MLLELLQSDIAAANDQELARVTLEEIQRPRADDGGHGDTIPLDELSAEGRDIDDGPHSLHKLLKLSHDEGLILHRCWVGRWGARRHARLEEHRSTFWRIVEDVLLPLEVLPRGHPHYVRDAIGKLLPEHVLQLLNGHGLLLLLEDTLDSPRHVRVLHRGNDGRLLSLSFSCPGGNCRRSGPIYARAAAAATASFAGTPRAHLVLATGQCEEVRHLGKEIAQGHRSPVARNILQSLCDAVAVLYAVARR
mmetsp:Transcript_9249/g.20562  ORF Transcript_9249/g.20562 Transcript_9249/m.20562 type:complete len:249 (+) Transcript_9249:1471-2217(+)